MAQRNKNEAESFSHQVNSLRFKALILKNKTMGLEKAYDFMN